MINCSCCDAPLKNLSTGFCDECQYQWDVKSPAQRLCLKTDRPSEYIVGPDESGRECVVATHHFIEFSITHYLYWANSPIRLREKTRELIAKSSLPYTAYEHHYYAADELTLLVKKFNGSFPDYVVLERNEEGGVSIVQVVSRNF